MIIVRFPNGTAVTYVQANNVQINETYFRLLSSPNASTAIAIVPMASGAVIELQPPSRIENPVTDLTIERALEMVLEHLRDSRGHSIVHHGHQLKKLKARLSLFDARALAWK